MSQRNLSIKQWLFEHEFIGVPDLVARRKELTPSDKLVLGYLLKCVRDAGGGACFPRQSRIQGALALSERTVRNSLARLVELNLVAKRQKSGKFENRHSYEIGSWPEHWLEPSVEPVALAGS